MIDPTKPLPVVLTGDGYRDPALDMSWEQIFKYRETRDPELVVCHEGKKPTWFHCQRLGKLYVANLIDSVEFGGEPARKLRAFRLGCRAIELSPERAADVGEERMVPDPKAAHQLAEGVSEAGMEFFDRVTDEFPMEALYEVGDVVRQFSSMPRKHLLPFVYRAG